MTSIRELVFLVTVVCNVTVVIKVYDDNTLCKSHSCTLSHRKFIFQAPHNINFFLFNCTLPVNVSSLSKELYTQNISATFKSSIPNPCLWLCWWINTDNTCFKCAAFNARSGSPLVSLSWYFQKAVYLANCKTKLKVLRKIYSVDEKRVLTHQSLKVEIVELKWMIVQGRNMEHWASGRQRGPKSDKVTKAECQPWWK